MKEIHLICNAHIDPIWQWTEDEGLFAALSTFRSAVQLAKEFDYIFCHNEALLYKAVAQYDPALFCQIKDLVKAGKWHIMGGWYLQPDCNMPSGESFVRQILVGRKFFWEQFGKFPTTAINFDPFGHTVGLVQILDKCGQDSYLFTRPTEEQCPTGTDRFIWEGLDGSRVKAAKRATYGTGLGEAAAAIRQQIDDTNEDVVCLLWGVGNHGGGPSRKDLTDLKELAKSDAFTLLHSTPETFFARIKPETVFKESLRISMPGCYTSMSRVKRKHIELENTLYFVEKLCSVAANKGLMDYPQQTLDRAVEDLLTVEFHDVLPGTVIAAGEENALQNIDHALRELISLRSRALYALSREEKPAAENTYPVLIFNPHPMRLQLPVAVEFSLACQNWDESKLSQFTVTDRDGKPVAAQQIKEESNITVDWRKRLILEADLAPTGLSRYDIAVHFEPPEAHAVTEEFGLCDAHKKIVIDPETGLLSTLQIGGVDYLSGGIVPMLFRDNADPWGMGKFQQKGMGEDGVPFTLCRKPNGVFAGMRPIQMIEDGAVCRVIEAFLECGENRIRLEYRLYKNHDFVDLHLDVFGCDKEKMLKLQMPLAQSGTLLGGTAFGTEKLFADGRENIAQRFVGVDGAHPFAVLDNCQYGSCYQNGVLSLSLLRFAGYCTHPIDDRPLYPTDRFLRWIDQGQTAFDFRLLPAAQSTWRTAAQQFNEAPYGLNVFLDGSAACHPFAVTVSNPAVALEAFKKGETTDGYVLRLYNAGETPETAELAVGNIRLALTFGKFEVKTVIYDKGALKEQREMVI